MTPDRARRVRALLFGVAVPGLFACAGQSAPRSTMPAIPAGAEASGGLPALASLSLREKAAQMVWPTVVGNYAAGDSPEWRLLRSWVTDEKVGGFTVSVGSPLEIAAKLNALQRLSAVPLLVGSDVEFGAGYRARGGWFLPNAIDLGGAVIFPPEMALGATRDTALAYEQGRVTAIEGRALGMHIAYAPILDVNNNAANPVINTRSYGENPRLAASMGASFIRGLQEHGMIATGKHFPGHGDTETNSHLALPVVTASRARLDSVELVPFRAALKAGVGAIMTFHGSMPALDSSGLPGTLSAPVLTGLLRRDMGFQGLVISDAMDMRGVLDRYGAVEAAKGAVAAGADILIQPLDVRQTIDAVVAGVREGRYPESRIDESVGRILAMKRGLGLSRRREVDLDSVRALVGDSAHLATARIAAQRSITLVKDSLRSVPLPAGKGTRVLSVTVTRRADLGAGVAFNAELARAYDRVRGEIVLADDPVAAYDRVLAAADSADVVVVSSYVSQNYLSTSTGAPRAFGDFMLALVTHGRRPVLVAFGNPYLLTQVPSVPAYLVAWGGFPVSQQAAALALTGQTPITGRLPISMPPLVPYGAGERREARQP